MKKASLKIPGHTVSQLLAKGGMAEVYLAEQTSLGRKVAIKVLDQNSGDADFVERFLKEARLVAALNHPSIITIHDFGVLQDKRLYLSMEYMEGGDLDSKLIQRISEAEALHILKELVKALIFIHGKGIVHRDIKPANILFRPDGSLALTDFGVAKSDQDDVKLTQVGTTVGSPAYCSPEQAQGLEVDHRSDIYSTGILFIEMLLGNNPYKADSFVNTSINHIQMEIPRLHSSHARFQKLVDKMVAKEPGDRFASAEQLLAFLNDPANFSTNATATQLKKLGDEIKTTHYPRAKEHAIGTLQWLKDNAQIFANYCKNTAYPFIKKQTIVLSAQAWKYIKMFAIYCHTIVWPFIKKHTIIFIQRAVHYSKQFISYCKNTVFPKVISLTRSIAARFTSKKPE